MAILEAIAGVLFAEGEDAGKVCQIIWHKDAKSGAATLLVPEAAYNRYSSRACLRALRIKVPTAKKVTGIKSAHGVVKYPTINYHLVRVDFITE